MSGKAGCMSRSHDRNRDFPQWLASTTRSVGFQRASPEADSGSAFEVSLTSCHAPSPGDGSRTGVASARFEMVSLRTIFKGWLYHRYSSNRPFVRFEKFSSCADDCFLGRRAVIRPEVKQRSL